MVLQMNGKRNYFLLNKRTDYERGYTEGLALTGRGIAPEAADGRPLRFVSRVFDSGEKEMEWHRLTIGCTGRVPSGRLVVCTAEETKLSYGGRETDMGSLIRDERMSFADKLTAMDPYQQMVMPASQDILLHGVRGRYLWFVLELYPQEEPFELSDFVLYFPGTSWIEKLPEIYAQVDAGGFLDRYLGIFQSLYEDMDRRIDAVPKLLDVDTADEEALVWMAEWLDFSEEYIWSKKQLRWLLKNAFRLSRIRGTRKAVEQFVWLYTGERPVITEWRQYKEMPHNERLYRDDPYTLMVFVRDETLHSEKERRTLLRIIEDVIPVYISLELVVLKPYLFLDNHTYIGLNSCIGKYRPGRLDGHLALSFSTLATREEPVNESVTAQVD